MLDLIQPIRKKESILFSGREILNFCYFRRIIYFYILLHAEIESFHLVVLMELDNRVHSYTFQNFAFFNFQKIIKILIKDYKIIILFPSDITVKAESVEKKSLN